MHRIPTTLSVVCTILCLLMLPILTFAASDFNSSVIVNNEAQLILSDAGGGEDVRLTFGESSGEEFYWQNAGQIFIFTDDVSIQGNLSASGNITINSDSDNNDAILTFGNSSGDEQLSYANHQSVFQFSTSVQVSSGTLSISDLVHCDTIDTNASGTLLCGKDEAVFEVFATETTLDYNNLTGSTIRLLSATSTNRPTDRVYTVETVGTGNIIRQTAYSGLIVYSRIFLNGTWGNWQLVVSESKAAEIAQSFDDIDKNITLAEAGDGARTIKVMPVGTNVASQVVSHADGNVIYIRRSGDASYSVLDRLDKHEVGTFTASQGDRIVSLKGDSVVSNGFGTIAWMSMALAGEEFYTYVARNASVGSPAHLYIASFGVSANITILQNGSAYTSLNLLADSVTDVDLNAIAEYQISSDQPIVLWYVGDDNSIDAKPLPPVSSDLMWFNTAANTGFTPRISALLANTNITINYQDGTQETATVQPGTPFVAKYDASYQQYQAPGAAFITSDGIISGANAADADGLNGTAWYSQATAAQHFFLPVSAQHISFVCPYETNIIVRDATDAVVTTLNVVRGAAVTNNQAYPAAVRYNLPGSDGEGYSFEAGVPCNAVFDSNEGGFAGDETVLLGGKLPYNANPIYRDTVTGQDVQIEIQNGVVTVNGL